MEKQVSKAETVFLLINTTSYVICEAITSNIGFNFESRVRGFAFTLVLLVEFCLIDLVFGYLIKGNFHVEMLVLGLFMGIYITLDMVYKEKIQIICKSYGAYYPFFIVILFGLLCISSIVYLFVIS